MAYYPFTIRFSILFSVFMQATSIFVQPKNQIKGNVLFFQGKNHIFPSKSIFFQGKIIFFTPQSRLFWPCFVQAQLPAPVPRARGRYICGWRKSRWWKSRQRLSGSVPNEGLNLGDQWEKHRKIVI